MTNARAEELKTTPGGSPSPQPEPTPSPDPEPEPGSGPTPPAGAQKTRLRLAGAVPPEVWNRLGTSVLPKLGSGDDLSIGIDFSVSVGSHLAQNMEAELRQILDDLGLKEKVRIEKS